MRAWRLVTAAAAVFAFSIIALGWYFFDRTGMLNAAFSKTPPALVVTAPSSAPKPASAPAPATPPVADASASQNTVAASPVSNHDKSAAEDARLKQAQHEHDVVLAAVEAAELERESLRRAIKAQQHDLMMQHEVALARERKRVNQPARAAELAILQAQSVEKAVEIKQAEQALPTPETPKKE